MTEVMPRLVDALSAPAGLRLGLDGRVDRYVVRLAGPIDAMGQTYGATWIMRKPWSPAQKERAGLFTCAGSI